MTLTFYFLQTSRAWRIAWLLEELGVKYNLQSANRQPNLSAPTSLGIPTSLGKSPAILDGSISVGESGAIAEYLCEKYDTNHRLMPADPALRSKVREYMWAAEGTFFIHGLAIWKFRLAVPASVKESAGVTEIDQTLSVPVREDFEWLSQELEKGNGKYLVGNGVTAADCMLSFSCQFIIAQQLGVKAGDYPVVEKWLRHLESGEVYKQAEERTGHHL